MSRSLSPLEHRQTGPWLLNFSRPPAACSACTVGAGLDGGVDSGVAAAAQALKPNIVTMTLGHMSGYLLGTDTD
jgi:hypothetical protein